MKLRNLIGSLALLTSGVSFGASGTYQSFGIIKINASTAVYYDMEGSTGNPDFQATSFGSFDSSVGNTLTLVGGELNTFKNGLSDVTSAKFDYRIFKTGDTPGSFSEFNMDFRSDLGGGNQKWDDTVTNVDILAGLTNGDYTLEVYAYANTSDGVAYSNNGGNNFKANFTVVPEPSSAALGLVGVALLLRRRRA